MRAADSGSASATFISTPTRRIGPRCCARAASGHAAAPPSSVMSSRRRISALCLGDGILAAQMSTLIEAKLASKPLPQCTANVAVGSFSEVGPCDEDVRSTPESRPHQAARPGPFSANKRHRRSAFSFDDFVGAADDRIWDGEPEGLSCLQVNGELDFRQLLNRQICRLLALKDAACIDANQAV
jgi:hypothetical protein